MGWVGQKSGAIASGTDRSAGFLRPRKMKFKVGAIERA